MEWLHHDGQALHLWLTFNTVTTQQAYFLILSLLSTAALQLHRWSTLLLLMDLNRALSHFTLSAWQSLRCSRESSTSKRWFAGPVQYCHTQGYNLQPQQLFNGLWLNKQGVPCSTPPSIINNSQKGKAERWSCTLVVTTHIWPPSKILSWN